jgi:hypothetical protein
MFAQRRQDTKTIGLGIVEGRFLELSSVYPGVFIARRGLEERLSFYYVWLVGDAIVSNYIARAVIYASGCVSHREMTE